ncbi:MAG: hypothetical protein U0075_16545 [Thermomicrobiales bacterium]
MRQDALRPRSWLTPVLAIVLLVLITGGLIWFAANSLLAGLCGSTEITRLTSPNGHHDAVLFEHNCGATTDFATHVSVLPAGAPLGNDAGNAFAAEADDPGPRARWGGPSVDVAWAGDDVLAIRYGTEAGVLHHSPVVEGVAIHVEQAP